jgi:hypothetical protein
MRGRACVARGFTPRTFLRRARVDSGSAARCVALSWSENTPSGDISCDFAQREMGTIAYMIPWLWLVLGAYLRRTDDYEFSDDPFLSE